MQFTSEEETKSIILILTPRIGFTVKKLDVMQNENAMSCQSMSKHVNDPDTTKICLVATFAEKCSITILHLGMNTHLLVGSIYVRMLSFNKMNLI